MTLCGAGRHGGARGAVSGGVRSSGPLDDVIVVGFVSEAEVKKVVGALSQTIARVPLDLMKSTTGQATCRGDQARQQQIG